MPILIIITELEESVSVSFFGTMLIFGDEPAVSEGMEDSFVELDHYYFVVVVVTYLFLIFFYSEIK